MFIAKFTQTVGHPFKSDKNGNFPFIGTVLTGKALGTIINGTMFLRDQLLPNTLYLCENVVNPEYPELQQVQIISAVSALEYSTFRTQLGAPEVTRNQPN